MSFALEALLLIVALAAELAGRPRFCQCALMLLIARLWLRCQREREAKQRYAEAVKQATERLKQWALEQ